MQASKGIDRRFGWAGGIYRFLVDTFPQCFLVQTPVRDYIAHPEDPDRPNNPHTTT
jgi:hypothetical protein